MVVRRVIHQKWLDEGWTAETIDYMSGFKDPYIIKLLLGVPLPEALHDPIQNLKFRKALLEANGYYEVMPIYYTAGYFGRLPSREFAEVLQTLENMGRLLPAWSIYSLRNNLSAIFYSDIEPDFSRGGIWRVKDTWGSWHRYHEGKVNVVKAWRRNKRWMRMAHVRLSP